MNDITFVIPPQNKGWILDHISLEIGKRHNGPVEYIYRYYDLPQSHVYWLAHYSIIHEVIRLNPHVPLEKCVVFFTHTSSDLKFFVPYFNSCKAVIAENPFYIEELRKSGVNETKLFMVPEASSPEMFKPHKRNGNGSILISGSYRRRKNFERIMNVAKLMPEKNFKIVTQLLEKWESAPRFRELPNVTIYEDIPYKDYPVIYDTCDVYLSCSKIEGGGPNSLIEAMHANLFPVVSDVGNAREFIYHGYNGLIFPVNSSSSFIAELIQRAYEPRNLMTDISITVMNFNWDNYAEEILEIILPQIYLTRDGFISKNVLS